MAIKWLSASRQSMQRIGFCKALVTDELRVRSGAELVEVLRELVTRKSSVTPDDLLLECLRAMPGSAQPYVDLDGRVEVSLQEYYICRHPSRSGWLSKGGVKEYGEGLPRYLGLLDSAYRPTDFGRVLQWGLLSKEELGAFQSVSIDLNPLTLTLPQQVFFVYALLSNDGDFLIPFVQTLSAAYGKHSFSYLDAGALVPEVLRILIDRFAGTGYTREEREQLRRLGSALESVEKAIAAQLEKQGSGSRREQITIPRLEWLIDTGLAEKASSEESSRRYNLTDSGNRFASVFGAEYERLVKIKYVDEAIESLLDHRFFGLTSNVFLGEELEALHQADVIEFLTPAYDTLAGVSGYCAVRPLLLLANALSISEGQPIVEYRDALEALEKAYRESPERVYYTVTRRGTDYQVRLGR